MESFFKEAIHSIKTTGTIKPSSKYLIRKCLEDINSEEKIFLEFGPGDGCFTKELADKISIDSKLYAFEINPSFYTYCTERFSTYENVFIIKGSAFNFDSILEKVAIDKVDCIVSSLPLSLFNESDIQILLEKVVKHLKKGGVFIQYQYSLGKYKHLQKNFDNVDVKLVIRNIPPAFVYKCYIQ